MNTLPLTLLKNRAAFWSKLEAQEFHWKDLASLLAFIIFGCAVYGAALGSWRWTSLPFYTAIKLPLLFIGSTAIVAVFNWMIATMLGSGLSFKSTVFIVFASMCIGVWIMLALTPLVLLFLLSATTATGVEVNEAQLTYEHNLVLVTHIFILALAGLTGNVLLFKGLRRIVKKGCQTWLLFCIWVAAFSFVGCQLSWILRPFIGSPFYEPAFMRPTAFERNFYEYIFQVIHFLITGEN